MMLAAEGPVKICMCVPVCYDFESTDVNEMTQQLMACKCPTFNCRHVRPALMLSLRALGFIFLPTSLLGTGISKAWLWDRQTQNPRTHYIAAASDLVWLLSHPGLPRLYTFLSVRKAPAAVATLHEMLCVVFHMTHLLHIFACSLHLCSEGATSRITRWSVLLPCNSQIKRKIKSKSNMLRRCTASK